MSSKDDSSKDKESGEKKKKYPWVVFFIFGNEFCERFTYYGLRAILILYLTQRLYYSDDTATWIYHLFAMIAYFFPLFGAIIADSCLGKFRTILYISILYACGVIVLSIGAFPKELSTMRLVSLIGLFTIGVGTGGIKPCVAAFGGDQFEKGQESHLQKFFSIFYMSINIGSVFSTFLTPVLREDVKCFGEKTCFPVAFGVPALLMIVAVVLFVLGKPKYKIKPPEGNIALKVTKCICYAIRKKCKSTERKKSHWLDYADDKFDANLIADIKILFHVLILYIPIPVFWALYDQQGSRWTLQATKLDGAVSSYHIKADQLQAINPLLIIIFIPLFEGVIYPQLTKCNLLRKPLQRMTTGGMLSAISFVMAGLISLKLEAHQHRMPSSGHSELIIINNSPCDIKIEDAKLKSIGAFKTKATEEMILNEESTWKFTPSRCDVQAAQNFTFNSSSQVESLMITVQNESLVFFKSEESTNKSNSGASRFRIFYNIDEAKAGQDILFKMVKENDDTSYTLVPETQNATGMTNYSEVPPGRYKIRAHYNDTTWEEFSVPDDYFKSGGVYILSIYNRLEVNRKVSFGYEIVKGNFLSILYQIPQYIIITAGEIMFSITGLEFSYSQSPLSMKSVVQAAWLLTVALGNLIVLIIAKLQLFERQSHELFLFASLMGVDMIIFAILAFFYKYVDVKIRSSEKLETTSSAGRSNEDQDEETEFNR